MKLYFAYGSNLNLEAMKRRCQGAVPLRAAQLSNWRIVRRLYADVEPFQGETVYGALYSVTDEDIAALDLYEGFPGEYLKETVSVTDAQGNVYEAFLYTMTAEYRKTASLTPDSPEYRKECSDGAQSWGIPNAFA